MYCALLLAAFCLSQLSTLSAQGGPAQIRLTADLRIDAVKESLTGISTVRPGPRGLVAISQNSDRQFRIYDSTGARIAAVGRRGAGPGEFQFVQVQGWIGDTVWAYDIPLRRSTFVSASGRVLRVAQQDNPPLTIEGRVQYASFVTPNFIASDGFVIGSMAVNPPGSDPRVQVQHVIGIRNGAAKSLLTAPLPDARWYVAFRYNPGATVSRDGARVGYLKVDSMVRKGGTFTVVVVKVNGDTAFVRSIPYEAVELTSHDVDSVRAALGRRKDADGFLQGPPTIPKAQIPPVQIPVNSFTLGPNGMTWIGLRHAGGRQSMLLLDANGRIVNSMELPPRSTFAAATATHVWMKETDDDGLVSLVRYRMSGVACKGDPCR